jgi:chromosome segregation ATPase
VAAQVLVKLGADLNRVRQQVIQLLHGYQGKEPAASGGQRPASRPERRLVSALQARVDAIESRLSAVEKRAGTGADTSELDRRIEGLRRDRAAAVEAQEYERAASLRDEEKQLLEEKAARQREWEAAHPGLPSLAERCARLGEELDRLRALLRQHGIEPGDKTA